MHHDDVAAEIAQGLLVLKARSKAAIHDIAEILGQFDLIGIVELRDNLADLGRHQTSEVFKTSEVCCSRSRLGSEVGCQRQNSPRQSSQTQLPENHVTLSRSS